MPHVLTETLQTLERYKTASPHFNELFDILGEILILREEYRHAMKYPIFPLDERLMAKKLSAGFPLLDFTTCNYDVTLAREYFLQLLEIAERRMPGETGEFARQLNDGEMDYADVIRNSFDPDRGKGFVVEADQDTFDLIDLFVEESLRPALEHIAEVYGSLIGSSGWSEGYCPICGKGPKIGEIRGSEEGRHLFCSQCGFEWYFDFVKCLFCGNEEQQSLAYFTVEGEEQYRVDVCNLCKKYIKIIDSRKAAVRPNFDIEDIATLHLDMLAAEEGYE